MRILVALFFVLLACNVALPDVMQTYIQTLYILQNMHSKAGLRVIANSIGHETHQHKHINNKGQGNSKAAVANKRLNDKFKRYFNIDSPLYTTNSYKFPVDPFIKNAMIAILGEDGVLEKGGFYMDGYIKTDGTAFIKMVKSFSSRKHLIDEINKARYDAKIDNPLSVIVHLLLTGQDTDNLVAWQKEQIQKGNLKQNDPCAPKLIVMYKCCTPTVLPLIGPMFGSLRIATD